ncbi:Lipopolysaccharide assembly, LptC-related [Rhabdaerophilaceae bacterium]
MQASAPGTAVIPARAARQRAGSAVLPTHLANNPQFVAAVRHSRRVRALRRAIPWLCLSTVLFLVLRSMTGYLLENTGISVGGVSIQDRKVVMDKPRLSGFKRDGSTYEMNAEQAMQDLRTPNLVELHKLTARIQQGAQGWTTLSGDRGDYDSKAETLDVKGNVRVKTDSGTEILLQEASIEFKPGHVRSNKPVEVRMPSGHIFADSVNVLDNGRQLIFDGRVRSEFVNSTGTTLQR